MIQGAGNVGAAAAREFSRAGCRVVGISDINGGLYNPKGLDVEKALDCKSRNLFVKEEVDADEITNVELLELECDILVPAAIENQITATNGPKLRCRMIVEGANGPTTPEADLILSDARSISCRTSSRMPGALSSLISNGSRTSRSCSGQRERSPSV